MTLCLIPLMGPFHLRFPLYNVVNVREVVAAFAPEALALVPLEPGSLEASAWQSTPEIALPHTVVPWARRRGLPLYPVAEASPDPAAPADFWRYAGQYEPLRNDLHRVEALLRPLSALLESGLTLERILSEVVPLIREHQLERERAFGDGPATDWLRERLATVAERILALPEERVAVLASVDHFPFLREALEDEADIVAPPPASPSEASRERSLLDFAFRVDVPDPAELLGQLRELGTPEARYHAANLFVANGHVAEALETLAAASQEDFSTPYYLPGYLLARLGQLYDLAEERAAALRCYRGVLALDWAPLEAQQVAAEGLEHPFEGLHDGVADATLKDS